MNTRMNYNPMGAPILPSINEAFYTDSFSMEQITKRKISEYKNPSEVHREEVQIPIPKKHRGDLEAMGGFSLPIPTVVPPQETHDSTDRLKVHNLLTNPTDEYTPLFTAFYPVNTPNQSTTNQQEQKTNETDVVSKSLVISTPFKFDKTNPKHAEIENLNQSYPQISNSVYEALKIQEIAQLPSGGSRLTKILQPNIQCENLLFLELFSCKQLTGFQEGLKLPNLKHIRLLMLNRLTSNGLGQLINACEQLESAFLMDLQTVITITIPNTCNRFTSLDIYECKSLEAIQIATNTIQELTVSDGRTVSNIELADPVNGLNNLKTLRISGCPKMPLSFLYNINISKLKKLDLVSNAPSAKAYMKVDESDFDAFVKRNCHHVEEITLDKVHNISLNTILELIDQCKHSLVNVTIDLTSIEKPKVREALRHCDNLKDWKVEKWYIKKKWTEW